MNRIALCIITCGICSAITTGAANAQGAGATLAEAAWDAGNASVEQWNAGERAIGRLLSQRGPLDHAQTQLQKSLIDRQKKHNETLFGSALVVQNTRFVGTVLLSPIPVVGPWIGSVGGAYAGNVLVKGSIEQAQSKFETDVLSLARQSNDQAIRDFFRNARREDIASAAKRLAAATESVLVQALAATPLSDEAQENLIREVLDKNFSAIVSRQGEVPSQTSEEIQAAAKRVKSFATVSINESKILRERLSKQIEASQTGFQYREIIQEALMASLDRDQADPATRRKTEKLLKVFSEGMSLDEQYAFVEAGGFNDILKQTQIDEAKTAIEVLRSHERAENFISTFGGAVKLAERLGDITGIPQDQRRTLSNLAVNVDTAQRAFSFYKTWLSPLAAGIAGPAGYLAMANGALDLLGGGGFSATQQDQQTAQDFAKLSNQLQEINRKLDTIIETQQKILSRLDALEYQLSSFQRQVNERFDRLERLAKRAEQRDKFFDTKNLSECLRALPLISDASSAVSGGGLMQPYEFYQKAFYRNRDKSSFLRCIETFAGAETWSINLKEGLLPPHFDLPIDGLAEGVLTAFSDYYHAAVLNTELTRMSPSGINQCFWRAFFNVARSRVFLFDSAQGTKFDCSEDKARDKQPLDEPSIRRTSVLRLYELSTNNSAIESVVDVSLQLGNWLALMPAASVRSKNAESLTIFNAEDLRKFGEPNRSRVESAWKSVMDGLLPRWEELIEIAAARQGILSGVHLADWGAHVLMRELGSEKSQAPERVVSFLNALHDNWSALESKIVLRKPVLVNPTLVARVAFGTEFKNGNSDVVRTADKSRGFQGPSEEQRKVILDVLNDPGTDSKLRPPTTPTADEQRYLAEIDWLFTVDFMASSNELDAIANVCRSKRSELSADKRGDLNAVRGDEVTSRYRYARNLNSAMTSATLNLQYPILTCLMTANPLFAHNVVRRFAYLRAGAPDSRIGLPGYRAGLASWDGLGLKGDFAPVENLALAMDGEETPSGWILKIRAADGSWLRVPLPTAEEVAGGRYIFTPEFVMLEELRNRVFEHRVLHGSPAVEVFAPGDVGRAVSRQGTSRKSVMRPTTQDLAVQMAEIAARALAPRIEKLQTERGQQ